ncbi:unnamed protein product [Chilo suppressalis]|uniref:Gustatory receptor n=1 Tax=Chilo suppressalis TaxID=168631 RepID=A0ABN8B179_CHISP|nr:unnamed protein product [Chilo suppressalis]
MFVEKPGMIKNGIRYKPECSVSGALGLVLRLSQLVGIGPLRFRKRNRDWFVSLSPSLCLISYVAATVLNTAALTGLLLDLQARPSKSARVSSPTLKFVWVSDYIVVLVIASVAAYGAPRRLTTTILCLARIQKINTGVSSKSSNEWKTSLLLTAFLLYVACVLTADYCIFLRAVFLSDRAFTAACLYSFYYFAYFLLVLLEMQYVFSALEVSKTMGRLNKLIGEVEHMLTMHYASLKKIESNDPIKLPLKYDNLMIDSMDTFKFDSGMTVGLASKSISETIRRLALTYMEVCEVVRQLDSSHGVGVLLLLLSFLLHLVITPYHLIVKITSSRGIDAAAALQVLWCGLHIACTFIVAEPSYRIQLDVQRTNLLVSHMLFKSNDAQVYKELEKFSMYLTLNEVIFRPLGVCRLTRSLVTSIIGSVATYLVIIIQFQLSEQ